jgi:hypothetical protein
MRGVGQGRRAFRQLQAEQGDVGVLVRAEDLGGEGTSVEQEAPDLGGLVDDVPVREDVALRRRSGRRSR